MAIAYVLVIMTIYNTSLEAETYTLAITHEGHTPDGAYCALRGVLLTVRSSPRRTQNKRRNAKSKWKWWVGRVVSSRICPARTIHERRQKRTPRVPIL